MSPRLSFSRMYLTSALSCLLLAVMRYWLMPEAETGLAQLMLRELLIGAAGLGLWGTVYGMIGKGEDETRPWDEVWFGLTMLAIGLVVGLTWLIDWSGWLWLYRLADEAEQAALHWVYVRLPLGLRLGSWLWLCSQVGTGVALCLHSKSGRG
jgi:hypothetical protein